MYYYQIASVVLFSVVVVLAATFLSYRTVNKYSTSLKKRELEMQRKVYELAILKELGERIGYSLNIQQIIDIITGSLHQFMSYSAASYMLIQPEKIMFKIHLEESVSRNFVEEVKNRMFSSLTALVGKDFSQIPVEELLSGAILAEEYNRPVKSFFNIPIVIGDKAVGVLTVADIKAGLYQEEEVNILYKIIQQASQAVTRLQEVVAIEQRKLNAMVESMSEGIVMTDKDYRIVVVNPAAKQAVGLEQKEEVSIFDFIEKFEGKFNIKEKLEESVALDKISVSNEVLLNDRYWQIIVSPVKSSGFTSGDEILGGVVIFHDITHDKEIERIRQDFTSMMVHELRSPLDGIKKLSTLLVDWEVKKNKADFVDFIQVINKNATTMLELVNDLLDVAKIEAGKFEVHPEPGDLKKVIESRVTFYQAVAAEGKITLTAQVAENFPTQVVFDETRIIQVINNLVSNALKFTDPDGQVSIQAFVHEQGKDIKSEAKQAGIKWRVYKTKKLNELADAVVVAITDSGTGIPVAKVSELFSKFKQLSVGSKKSDKPGTGLGLVIAKGLTEAHGGTIGVESEEGVGTTFYFTLPLNSI